MPSALISQTEAQQFSALRSFLLSILPTDVSVVRGQVNRVSEPATPDFVVMWPLRAPRLSTNYPYFYDNVFTGSISGSTLTVASFARQASALQAGMVLLDGSVGALATDTLVGAQLTGLSGGTGTYVVTPTQDVGAETMYAGIRDDVVPTEWRVQLDVHGPNSYDNSKVIEGLFRSEVASDFFVESGVDLQALFCEEPRQVPFINDQQQYEYRWVVEAAMQVNPVIGSPQQFADQVVVAPIDVQNIVDMESGWLVDEDGNLVLDEDGNPIPVYP